MSWLKRGLNLLELSGVLNQECWASETARSVKAFAAKPDDLSLGPYGLRRNCRSQVVLRPPHTFRGALTPPHRHVNIKVLKIKMQFKNVTKKNHCSWRLRGSGVTTNRSQNWAGWSHSLEPLVASICGHLILLVTPLVSVMWPVLPQLEASVHCLQCCWFWVRREGEFHGHQSTGGSSSPHNGQDAE